MQPLCSSSITEPSSLLRVAPPLCPASVLSLLWGLHLSFSLSIRATGSHVPHMSLDQVHAGRRLGSKQVSPRLIPDQRLHPGFDAVPTLSTLHQRFTCVHLHDPYLIPSCGTFSLTLTTSAFDLCSLRRFEASSCKAAPRGPPSSHVQLRTLLYTSCARGTPSSAYRTKRCPRFSSSRSN